MLQKFLSVLLITILIPSSLMAAIIRGEVQSLPECKSEQTMVWLSLNEKDFKKKLLLMHTLVPEKGTFEFYVKPGKYLLVGSNEKGCSWEKEIEIKNKDIFYKVAVSAKSDNEL